MKPEALAQVQLALAARGPSRAADLTGCTGLTADECAEALAELGRREWASECLGVWTLGTKSRRRAGGRVTAAGEQRGRATPTRGGDAERIDDGPKGQTKCRM